MNLLNESLSLRFCVLGLSSNGSQVTKTNFVFGLSRSTADCARIFSEPFSKKERVFSFFFLLDYASRTCSMPRLYLFCTYLLPNDVKYYLNSQNLPPF